MRTRLFTLPLLLLVASLTACVDTDAPLSDPATAKADPDLIGVWENVHNPNQYLFISRSSVQNAPAGVMHVIKAGIDKNEQKSSGHATNDFSITRVGGAHIVNLFVGSSRPSDYEDWLKDDTHGCQLLRYELSGNTLTVWEQADSNAEKAALDAGSIRRAGPSTANDDAGSVYDYLTHGGVAALFPDSAKDTYVRVTR